MYPLCVFSIKQIYLSIYQSFKGFRWYHSQLVCKGLWPWLFKEQRFFTSSHTVHQLNFRSNKKKIKSKIAFLCEILWFLYMARFQSLLFSMEKCSSKKVKSKYLKFRKQKCSFWILKFNFDFLFPFPFSLYNIGYRMLDNGPNF